VISMKDLLGAFTQSGMTTSTDKRMKNALSAGGEAPDSLPSKLSGGFSGGGLDDALSQLFGGGIGGMLGNVLNDAGQAVGGKRNLAIGGIGALAGALFGGGRRSMGGAIGAGVMALLGRWHIQPSRKAASLPPGCRQGCGRPKRPPKNKPWNVKPV
jgi:hypothetical protein